MKLVKLHLVLASFFIPFVLLFSVTGGLYLLGFKGSEKKQLVHQEFVAGLSDSEVRSKIEGYAKSNNFAFQYVKVKGNQFILRPSSRHYYSAEVIDDQLSFYVVETSLQKRMMEIHKGHGPLGLKYFSIAWAVGLFSVLLSGLVVGYRVKRYRKIMLVSGLSGVSVFILLLTVW